MTELLLTIGTDVFTYYPWTNCYAAYGVSLYIECVKYKKEMKERKRR